MTLNKQWKSLLALSLSVVLFTATSCDDDDDNDEIKTQYTISGNLTGAQEVPPVTTTATGTLTGSYNSATNTLTYTLNWTDLTGNPTLMHFHGPAGVGENNSPVVDITGFPATTSGSHNGSAQLTDAQESQLLQERWYVNIHTPNHGSGEIRAQAMVE